MVGEKMMSFPAVTGYHTLPGLDSRIWAVVLNFILLVDQMCTKTFPTKHTSPRRPERPGAKGQPGSFISHGAEERVDNHKAYYHR